MYQLEAEWLLYVASPVSLLCGYRSKVWSPVGWVISKLMWGMCHIPIGYAVVMKVHYTLYMIYVYIAWVCIVIGFPGYSGVKSANS